MKQSRKKVYKYMAKHFVIFAKFADRFIGRSVWIELPSFLENRPGDGSKLDLDFRLGKLFLVYATFILL